MGILVLLRARRGGKFLFAITTRLRLVSTSQECFHFYGRSAP